MDSTAIIAINLVVSRPGNTREVNNEYAFYQTHGLELFGSFRRAACRLKGFSASAAARLLGKRAPSTPVNLT